MSQNEAHGDSGACYGDSGGPTFLGAGDDESDIVVAVTSTGDVPCWSTNVSGRTDSPSARAFLDAVTVCRDSGKTSGAAARASPPRPGAVADNERVTKEGYRRRRERRARDDARAAARPARTRGRSPRPPRSTSTTSSATCSTSRATGRRPRISPARRSRRRYGSGASSTRDRGTARTWLLGIARTTALDWFRSESRRRRREEAAALPERVDEVFVEGLRPSSRPRSRRSARASARCSPCASCSSSTATPPRASSGSARRRSRPGSAGR